MSWASLFLISIPLLFAQPSANVPDSRSSAEEMQGIRYDDYKNFKDWKLVTVRFRRDTNEMRFTYANPAAAKALNESVKNYPDGAVFAKVGYFSLEDPAFTSSAVPNGPARIQYMVRNKTRYSNTDGWGYAIFNSQGKTFNGDQEPLAQACAACHRLVPERGYVFSQEMGDKNWISAAVGYKKSSDVLSKNLEFSTEQTASLPEGALIRKYLKKNKKFRSLKGELRRNAFWGTYDEISPTLLKEAMKEKMPAALLSEKDQAFALAVAHSEKKDCPKNQQGYLLIWVRSATPNSTFLKSDEHINYDTTVVCR